MLTENEKYLCGILFVLFLIATGLSIYFGIKANKKCTGTGLPEAPTLKSFSLVQDNPGSRTWSTPTSYKYSYVDKNNNNEGKLSDSSPDIVTNTPGQTNPVINLNADYLDKYNVNVYRKSIKTNNQYVKISPKISSDGTFVDTDNPSPEPPTPPSIPKPSTPSFSKWQDSGGGGPKCPDSSTKCSSSYCTQEQMGNCPKENPWSCYSGGGKGGCSPDPNTLENEALCTKYCLVKY